MSAPARQASQDLVTEYGRLGAPCSGQRRRRAGRRFFVRFGDLVGWERSPLAGQLAGDRDSGSFVAWLIVSGRLTPTAEYLLVSGGTLTVAGDLVYPRLSAEFALAAGQIGYSTVLMRRQWSILLDVAALAGTAPTRLSLDMVDAAMRRIRLAGRDTRRSVRNVTAAVFGMQTVLFHLGLLDRLPARDNGRGGRRDADWQRLNDRAPVLTATMRDYIDQMATRLRPKSVDTIEKSLRLFANYLIDHHPEVTAVAHIGRDHVQAYISWLAARPGLHGRTLANQTQRSRIGALAVFFARLEELDITDVPVRPPVRSSDLPIKDDPLPRFIDDAASAKLMTAARDHPDLFTRVAVELLARTGMRQGELLGLTIDAIVQIGSSYWLRIPLGKLHTDRYVPLHPQVKTLLDQWIAHRGDHFRSNLMFLERGRRIGPSRLAGALTAAANAAGIGHVTPHQLRHTLATQAINRGMSLEAIAALLGHKSMSMTLVYARIADRTVADEYFAVTEKVEALYDQPRQLPADAEGAEMAKLRREMHQRMLGNGYCARPVGLDCHFESICESCTFFQTTIEFRPTLQRQRDDAADKGQLGRQKVFDGLLERLDHAAS